MKKRMTNVADSVLARTQADTPFDASVVVDNGVVETGVVVVVGGGVDGVVVVGVIFVKSVAIVDSSFLEAHQHVDICVRLYVGPIEYFVSIGSY